MGCSVGKNSRLMNCNDVAAKLISALENNDIEEFTNLLNAKPEQINKHLEHPHGATYLQLACHKGQADFVKFLLDQRAEVDTKSATKYTQALHMACYNAHHDCVKLLLDAKADVNSRDDFAGQTPLHATLSSWSWRYSEESKAFKRTPWVEPMELWSKFKKCFDLLLKHTKVELEAKTDGGRTPLEDAVHYKNDYAIKALINRGAEVNARVEEEARDLKRPANEAVIKLIAEHDKPLDELDDIDKIRYWIRKKDPFELKKRLGELKDHLDDKDRRYPCVRYCINEGSVECLQALLDAGADPNLSVKFESSPPIIRAAFLGKAKMLKILLANPKTDINACQDHKQQTALHIVVRALSHNKDILSSKYFECLRILLESKAINIDSRDLMGNTALHYAAGTGVEEAVLRLLHRGANLGSENRFKKTPIQNILHSTLEKFLDQCMEQSENKGRASRNYYITFKYNFLARQEEPRKRGNSNPEGASNLASIVTESDNPIPETASPPQNVSNSEHTEGSSNPESIHRVDIGNDNSSPETASRSQNVSNSEHAKGDYYSESENLWYLSCSRRHKDLLRHPVVTSFLLLKWHKKIRKYFYINLAFYIFTVFLLTVYLLLWEQTTDPQIGLNILVYLLDFFVGILIFREIFQIVIAPRRHFCCIENYFELGMGYSSDIKSIIFKRISTKIGMILFTVITQCYYDESEFFRNFAAMAVICAYISLMLLAGQHPRWSLLKEACTCVTRSFRNLLEWYSILILGFIFSFHILFKSPTTDESSANCTTSEPAQNNETQNFQTLPLTTLKMVAMMTGELNFDELPFYMSPVISRVIFAVFVFLIPVVLLNLLNGLAVSDTRAIYREAETSQYVNLVELVSYAEMIESILLGHPYHFLSKNYQPFSCLPCANYCRNFVQSCSTLLFDRRFPYAKSSTDCLPAKAYKVYYNRVPRAWRKDVGDFKRTYLNSFSLPDEIIEAACDRLKRFQRTTGKRNKTREEKQDKKQTRVSRDSSRGADPPQAQEEFPPPTHTNSPPPQIFQEGNSIQSPPPPEHSQEELLLTTPPPSAPLDSSNIGKDPGPLAIHPLKDQFDELKQKIKSLSENLVEIMSLLERA